MKLISGEHVGALAMSEPNGSLCDISSSCLCRDFRYYVAFLYGLSYLFVFSQLVLMLLA